MLERLNIYLRDNPACSLKDAAEILGVKHTLVRKWKSVGWIKHITKAEARKQCLPLDKPEVIKANITKPVKAPRKIAPRKPSSGEVVPSSDDNDNSMAATPASNDPYDIDSLIAKGKDLKISQLRSLIKAHLMMSVSDSKSVSNYAAGLKALSGVQDVELEDIYENEQLMRIYVPVEDADPHIVEVEPIEY